jgi:hypothetical protein
MPNENSFNVVLTLEARSNVMLDVISDYFKLSDAQIFNEIQMSASEITELLLSKDIDYKELKRALVPSADKLELVYIFDWCALEDSFYGPPIMNLLLSVLPKDSTRSILAGDWIHDVKPRKVFENSDVGVLKPNFDASDLPDTLYFVYLNNLSTARAEAIHNAFKGIQGYLGSFDMTCLSVFKGMLSTMLVRDFIQHKNVILLGHEDDRDDQENYSLKLYDFESYGFSVRSVPSWMYGTYLSYKIERPVFEFDQSDRHFSLNAMTPSPLPLSLCKLEVDQSKLEYLISEKQGSLKRMGFEHLDTESLAKRIQEKIDGSYIYCLSNSEEHGVLKFNIILEEPPHRCLCVLKYIPESQRLEVITLY